MRMMRPPSVAGGSVVSAADCEVSSADENEGQAEKPGLSHSKLHFVPSKLCCATIFLVSFFAGRFFQRYQDFYVYAPRRVLPRAARLVSF